jgi:hypothetical protein
MSNKNLDEAIPGDEFSIGPTSITVSSEAHGKNDIIKMLLDLDSFELKVSSMDDGPLWKFHAEKIILPMVKAKENKEANS